eukprot:360823-Chlamydomonas_euryale.AAC.4
MEHTMCRHIMHTDRCMEAGGASRHSAARRRGTCLRCQAVRRGLGASFQPRCQQCVCLGARHAATQPTTRVSGRQPRC